MPTIQSVTVGPADQAGTITCSVVVNAGPDLALLAVIHCEDAAGDCTAMTRDGQSLSEHGEIAAGAWSRVEMWKLVNPNTGTATLTATVVGPGADRARLVVWVLEDVDQTTPFRDAVGSWGDTGLSDSLDANAFGADDLIIDALTIDATGHNPVPSLTATEMYDDGNGVSSSFEMAGSWQLASDGDLMDWTWSNSGPWSHLAAAVVKAAAATQKLRPDGDLATTGWSTAPLWSKIEEETADGTVITGVAS